jgi:hypothetical protein
MNERPFAGRDLRSGWNGFTKVENLLKMLELDV